MVFRDTPSAVLGAVRSWPLMSPSPFSVNTCTCTKQASSTLILPMTSVAKESPTHHHLSGVRMVNEQFRDGVKVREGSIEVWEFDQQGNAAVPQQPFEIVPGDSFRTSCYYRVSSGTTFGLGSQEEMCIAFMFYYPRQLIFNTFPWFCAHGLDDFEACNSPHEFEILSSEMAMGRYFGNASSTLFGCEDPAFQLQPTSTPSSAITETDPTSAVSPSYALKMLVSTTLLVAVLILN